MLGFIGKSNSGSALLAGMIAAVSTSLVGALILSQSIKSNEQTKFPRIKAIQTRIEAQIQDTHPR